MVELADLEMNVLEFVHKNFSYLRTATLDGVELAVFHRTETENETQFRPKLVRLNLVVPRAWIIYDLAADLLVLGRDGHTPGPRPVGTAQEAGAETLEFREQGIAFTRVKVPGSFLYVPTEFEPAWTSALALSELGLTAEP